MKILRLFSILIIVSVLMLTACASSDTTKVTIYFAKNGHASLEQQKLPLIDKILNLFSSKAYAQIHVPSDTANYFLYVTAGDMDTVYTPFIDGSYTSISVDVPSGNNRVFTLFSFSQNGNFNYVGQNVANLRGGDTSISINMFPCLNNITVTNSGYVYVNWTYDSTLEGKFTTVNIYRACYGTDPLCDGSIALPTSWSIGSAGSGSYPDMSGFSEGNVYYYLLTIDTGSFANGGLIAPTNFSDFFINDYFIAAYMMGEYYAPVTSASWVGTWIGTTNSTCGYYSGQQTFNITSTGGNGLNFDWTIPVPPYSGSTTGTFSGNTATSTDGLVVFYVSGHTLISTEADSCQTGTFSNNY
jgi:hypothetical protein